MSEVLGGFGFSRKNTRSAPTRFIAAITVNIILKLPCISYAKPAAIGPKNEPITIIGCESPMIVAKFLGPKNSPLKAIRIGALAP